MRPLRREDILDVARYERVRDVYRPRVIEHKRQRRISVGPQVTLLFEDRETLRYQIQEMTRVERTTEAEKVQVEVDVYNELVPGPDELSATLFIEIPELDQIQPALDRLIGIDEHVAFVLEGLEPVFARFDTRQMEADRISAVHYLRFSLSPAHARALRSGTPASLRIDHPHYRYETELEPAKQASLARDLDDGTPDLMDPAWFQPVDRVQAEVLSETDRVRASRVSAPGARERILVEPVAPGACLDDASPELLAELFETARRLAREAGRRSTGARVKLDLVAAEPGALRFDITALD